MASNNIGVIFFLVIAYSVYIAYSTEFDLSLVPEHCLKGKSIENDYVYTGDHWRLGNMNIYETRNKTTNRVLILVYDIFGMHNNSRQVADILADKYGFRVVMPDFFRTSPWNADNFPPKNPQDLADFIDKFGNWDRTVKTDILDVIDHFRTTENTTEFGIFGFCWGGKISVEAATELGGIIKGAGLVHPSSVTNEEANGVEVPMYLLPSQNEPNMLPFYIVLQQKFGTNCGHRRFDDMPHGFAGARGNFSNPLNVQRVNEVIDILGTFFNRNLA